MKNGLVSIVTPCYNTGSYVHRLLDSILQQTYPYIEMYVIDDGSTDNSAEVVKSYISKFQSRGFSLTLISQANSGQSVAIREGMKFVKGQYFVWPDSDDFYASPNAIECMVNTFIRKGDEYGLIRTQENLLEDHTLKRIAILGGQAQEESARMALFEDCLFAQNGFYFCPGAYMADFQKLKDSTTLDIYTEKNAGQNWQLMLPLILNYKCYTIKKPLYNVIARTSSHSRGQYDGYERTLIKIASYERTILETLKRINRLSNEECSYYTSEIKKKYCKERIALSFNFRKKKEFDEFFAEAAVLGCISQKEKLLSTFFKFPILIKILRAIDKSFVIFKSTL